MGRHPIVRLGFIAFGITFLVWMALGYQVTDLPTGVLVTTPAVRVTIEDSAIHFQPRQARRPSPSASAYQVEVGRPSSALPSQSSSTRLQVSGLPGATEALADPEDARATPQQTRQDRRRIKELERDLRRKEKALAETTALLVLSKKLEAIFHKDEDE